MASYLLIESRDPFESKDASYLSDLAVRLAKAGSSVSVLLVQNGVFAARRGTHAETVRRLAAAGVDVFADDFSLRERAITATSLADGVKTAAIGCVIDHLAAGHKVLWH